MWPLHVLLSLVSPPAALVCPGGRCRGLVSPGNRLLTMRPIGALVLCARHTLRVSTRTSEGSRWH